jgi:hypothetical protein
LSVIIIIFSCSIRPRYFKLWKKSRWISSWIEEMFVRSWGYCPRRQIFCYPCISWSYGRNEINSVSIFLVFLSDYYFRRVFLHHYIYIDMYSPPMWTQIVPFEWRHYCTILFYFVIHFFVSDSVWKWFFVGLLLFVSDSVWKWFFVGLSLFVSDSV